MPTYCDSLSYTFTIYISYYAYNATRTAKHLQQSLSLPQASPLPGKRFVNLLLAPAPSPLDNNWYFHLTENSQRKTHMYMAEQARQQTRNRVGKVSVYRTQTRIGRGPAHPHLDLETPSTRLPFSSPMPGPRNGTRSSYHATVCSLSCCSCFCCCCCFTVLLKIDHVVIAFVLCGCTGVRVSVVELLCATLH